MKFENILEGVGSFGLFQKVLCFTLIPLTTGLIALTYYTQIFILTAPNHVCRQYNEEDFKNGVTGAYESNILDFSDGEPKKTKLKRHISVENYLENYDDMKNSAFKRFNDYLVSTLSVSSVFLVWCVLVEQMGHERVDIYVM